jgi:hypothetical protein
MTTTDTVDEAAEHETETEAEAHDVDLEEEDPRDDVEEDPEGPVDGEDGLEDDDAPQPVFTSVEQFVTERFVPVFCRPEGGQFRWCAEWWRHPEAVSRLQALWHSWEVMRLEPGTGMAIWYRDYLDTQLPVLLGDTGPFHECTSRRHHDPRPLPLAPVPGGWFDD